MVEEEDEGAAPQRARAVTLAGAGVEATLDSADDYRPDDHRPDDHRPDDYRLASESRPPPRIIDAKYEVLERLGRGAMGEVRLARHIVTGKEVALKLLPRQGDEASVTRFLREVRLVADVDHPGVVEVYDAGEDEPEELLYVAMERLRGQTLGEYMEEHPEERRQLVSYLGEMLGPLAAAHRANVVHRDLKPENVFLHRARPESEPEVRLLDFGIAFRPGETRATATGVAIGTPVYMSPEQATRPREVDRRADVWSFGVMLFEAVSGGRLPFEGETPASILVQLASPEPPPPLRDFVEGLDPELEGIVDRCLRRDPAERFADGAELAAALSPILARKPALGRVLGPDEPRGAPPPPASRSRRGWLIGLALLVVGVVGLSALAWPREVQAPVSLERSAPASLDLEGDTPESEAPERDESPVDPGPAASRPRRSATGPAPRVSAENEEAAAEPSATPPSPQRGASATRPGRASRADTGGEPEGTESPTTEAGDDGSRGGSDPEPEVAERAPEPPVVEVPPSPPTRNAPRSARPERRERPQPRERPAPAETPPPFSF